MVPPLATSMNGYITVVNRSPVATTSLRRKNTTLSPSVCAFGWWMICTASPLNRMSRRLLMNVSVGHSANGTSAAPAAGLLRRCITFSCAITAAWAVAAAPRSPTTLPPARVRPALAIASLPPMWSPCTCVLTT